jgi:integration host factor subunit beta
MPLAQKSCEAVGGMCLVGYSSRAFAAWGNETFSPYTSNRLSFMNRSDLIQRLAAKFPQFSLTDIDLATKTVLACLGKAIEKNWRAEIRGFGSFTAKVRPPHAGRNPRTGVKVEVPERRSMHFKPGKELRASVNNCSNPIKRGSADNA